MCYLAALQHLGITQNNTGKITEFETAPFPPDRFNSNWTQYPGNSRFDPKMKLLLSYISYTQEEGEK